mgnify:CR=1 FL=1
MYVIVYFMIDNTYELKTRYMRVTSQEIGRIGENVRLDLIRGKSLGHHVTVKKN